MLCHRLIFHGRRDLPRPQAGLRRLPGGAQLCPSYGEGELDPVKAAQAREVARRRWRRRRDPTLARSAPACCWRWLAVLVGWLLRLEAASPDADRQSVGAEHPASRPATRPRRRTRAGVPAPDPAAARRRTACRRCACRASAAARRCGCRSCAGTPMVLNVWAAWCVNCDREMPLFADAGAGPASRCGSSASTTRPHETYGERSAADFGVPFPSVHDEDGDKVAPALRATAPPQTLFVDRRRHGRRHARSARSPRRRELDDLIEPLPRRARCDDPGAAARRTTICPTGCGRWPTGRRARPARAAQPVPAARRGRPRVRCADAVRRGRIGLGRRRRTAHRARPRHAQPRRPGRRSRAARSTPRTTDVGRRRTARGRRRRPGSTRPASRCSARCPRCSCRRAASS